MRKKASHIVIDELPEEQRAPLRKWLIGQTMPVVPGKGDCCFSWDYERFLKYWKKGQTAPVDD